ncbi:MAG: serine protease [Ruminococcaceae bacterium]|nr:serine protease [Oscillospiraceae bacterium]
MDDNSLNNEMENEIEKADDSVVDTEKKENEELGETVDTSKKTDEKTDEKTDGDTDNKAKENSTPYSLNLGSEFNVSNNGKKSDNYGKQDKKKTVLIIAVTAVYALAMGVVIGILLSFLYSGGKTANYNPVGVSTEVSDEAKEDAAALSGIAKAKESVVVITTTTIDAKGTATGIVLTDDGYILTNHHAIDGALSITVTFADGISTSATLRGSSEADDLAVIKVEREGLIPAEFASTSTCYVGQEIYVIGTPVSTDYRWTTTQGIISYVDREIKIYNDSGTLQKKLKLLQTDAMLNPGNSGGPMLNTDGQVLGIINMKLAGDVEGIGFAIPSDGAIEIANAIMKDGNADSVNSSISSKRPILGIVGVYIQEGLYYVNVEQNGQSYIRVASAEEKRTMKDKLIYSEYSGLYVNSVTQNTGAYGKLQRGDVIVEVEGEEVTSRSQFSSVLDDMSVGDTVEIKFRRDGALCSVDIELTAEE